MTVTPTHLTNLFTALKIAANENQVGIFENACPKALNRARGPARKLSQRDRMSLQSHPSLILLPLINLVTT